MRTITDFYRALAARQVSAVELATDALAKATAAKGLNAFLHVDADLTLAEARAADKHIAAGVTNNRLLGVPIAH
ncbi:MAG: Asp-tRNA(Asn)/Glu-tRNA(Gln) amidotransferase GatCAB subunit A, partial [Burkholderiales bacterium]